MPVDFRGNLVKFILVLLVVSVSVNIFLFMKLNENPSQRFRLVSPAKKIAVDSDNQDNSVVLHYQGLREKIEEDINSTTKLENVGVFVQDIRTGAWMGINEREEFLPASLLKIPIMMVILKKVERGEMTLNDTIEITILDLDSDYGELYKQLGAKFTVWELMKEMILSSDNTAKNALLRRITFAELNSVFVHVGIPNPYIAENASVTPRGYTRMFKSLYFSTFLSPELSEKALDITTDTREEDLISAGVPPEIQVAHKFGLVSNGLHDCGIVYHPKNPYFLCVMNKNMEIQKSRELIAGISRDVFDFVNSQ